MTRMRVTRSTARFLEVDVLTTSGTKVAETMLILGPVRLTDDYPATADTVGADVIKRVTDLVTNDAYAHHRPTVTSTLRSAVIEAGTPPDWHDAAEVRAARPPAALTPAELARLRGHAAEVARILRRFDTEDGMRARAAALDRCTSEVDR